MLAKLILTAVILVGIINLGSFLVVRSHIKSLNQAVSTAISTQALAARAITNPDASSVSSELVSIKNELASIKAELRGEPVLGTQTSDIATLIAQLEADTLPVSSISPAPSAGITIKDAQFKQVNIYQEKLYSSKITGTIDFGKVYSFTKKESGWYLLSPASGTTGWVNMQYVKETGAL